MALKIRNPFASPAPTDGRMRRAFIYPHRSIRSVHLTPGRVFLAAVTAVVLTVLVATQQGWLVTAHTPSRSTITNGVFVAASSMRSMIVSSLASETMERRGGTIKLTLGFPGLAFWSGSFMVSGTQHAMETAMPNSAAGRTQPREVARSSGQKPVDKFRDGPVHASIWENQGPKGAFRTAGIRGNGAA
jgi:hypothetical protein